MATDDREGELCSFHVFIPRALIRRVKARAAMEDRQLADITAAALTEYLAIHEQSEGRGNEILDRRGPGTPSK